MNTNRKKPRRLSRKGNSALFLGGTAIVLAAAMLAIAARPAPGQSKPVKPEIAVAADFDTVMVPTPSRTIARGEKLDDVTLTYVKWPKNRLTSEYITSVDSCKGTLALATLPEYLPIPKGSITRDPLDKNVVVERIPEGMRAITVRVDAESAVEGWARSGNYVDVILLRAAKNQGLGLEARVIAENVKILSAGQSAAPLSTNETAPKAPQTVTLLTTQEDALRIKTAGNIGKLTFALRGAKDSKPATAVSMNQQKLLGSSPVVETKKADYTGYARDSQGRVYVLADDARWMRTVDIPQGLAHFGGQALHESRIKDDNPRERD